MGNKSVDLKSVSFSKCFLGSMERLDFQQSSLLVGKLRDLETMKSKCCACPIKLLIKVLSGTPCH